MEGGRNIESCFALLTEQGFGAERQLFAKLLDTVFAYYWGNMTLEPHKIEKLFGNSGSDVQSCKMSDMGDITL